MVSFGNPEFKKKELMYPPLSIYIKKQIVAGVVQNNEELPSQRELPFAFSIDPNTIQKVYKQLGKEGMIKTINIDEVNNCQKKDGARRSGHSISSLFSRE